MPAHERVRRDEERPPACSRKESTCRSQEGSVSGLEMRARILPSQDGELVPKHEDLEFLEPVRAEAQHEQLQDTAKREIREREEHEQDLQVDAATAARLYAESRD